MRRKRQLKTQNFQEAQYELRSYLQQARNELYCLLKKNFTDAKILGKGNEAHGILSKENDRRDYYWVRALYNDREYWLTLFFHDIDSNSGHTHVQIGRIQFWKYIQNGRLPNMSVSFRGTKSSFVQHQYSSQPKSGATYIGSAEYKPNTVANDFIEFVKEDSNQRF